MSWDLSNNRVAFKIVQLLTLLVILALPWLLGGQLLELQLVVFVVTLCALLSSLSQGISGLRIPLILALSLSGYVLVQWANPAFVQEWQTGLRVWSLVPVDHITWLPSSIDSDFTDASPLRFLLFFLPAVFVSLALFGYRSKGTETLVLTLISVNSALIGLVGLIQLNLESRSTLGLFQAVDEGMNLFYATFLYKNQAAAFLNLGMAASFVGFFLSARNSQSRRSNPSWIFLILAGVLLIGVVFSRSRFGFVCSLIVLFSFVPLAMKQLRQSAISKKWMAFVSAFMAIVVLGGGTYLFNTKGTKHLKTLSTEITEDFSFKQRQLAYKSELRMFAEKTIYGWGAGNFRHGFRRFQDMESEREQIRNNYMERHELNFFWQHAHNDYLEWLIELGVVGTLILFSIPGYFFWIIFKSKLWKDPVPLMLLTGLGSTMVHGLIDFPFRNPAVLVTWLALLAVIARLCEPKGTK